jgi:heptaprenyl diphosphate synthase
MKREFQLDMAHFYTFLLLSLVLFVFESFIPRPLPWLKLGLANIMVVSSFAFFSPVETFKLVLYRVLIGAIFLGTIGSPGFLLSLGGGILAWSMMIVLYSFVTRNPITISIHGGVFHYIGQILIAYFLFLKNDIVFYLLPYLLISGMVSGLLIGLMAAKFISLLEQRERKKNKKGTAFTVPRK